MVNTRGPGAIQARPVREAGTVTNARHPAMLAAPSRSTLCLGPDHGGEPHNRQRIAFYAKATDHRPCGPRDIRSMPKFFASVDIADVNLDHRDSHGANSIERSD